MSGFDNNTVVKTLIDALTGALKDITSRLSGIEKAVDRIDISTAEAAAHGRDLVAIRQSIDELKAGLASLSSISAVLESKVSVLDNRSRIEELQDEVASIKNSVNRDSSSLDLATKSITEASQKLTALAKLADLLRKPLTIILLIVGFFIAVLEIVEHKDSLFDIIGSGKPAASAPASTNKPPAGP